MEINKQDLIDKLQSAIDNINHSIKSTKLGINSINNLTQQKTILNDQIDSLKNKEVVNEDDLKTTTRIIAIATTKQLSSEPSKGLSSILFTGVIVAFIGFGIYYYIKKK
jgi:hypothetical protein